MWYNMIVNETLTTSGLSRFFSFYRGAGVEKTTPKTDFLQIISDVTGLDLIALSHRCNLEELGTECGKKIVIGLPVAQSLVSRTEHTVSWAC